SCAVPGIAGIGRISRAAYPDPTALDEQSPYFDAKAGEASNPWSAVDVEFVETLPQTLTLPLLKAEPLLAQMPLVRKGNRLSVMPVSKEEWATILALCPGRNWRSLLDDEVVEQQVVHQWLLLLLAQHR